MFRLHNAIRSPIPREEIARECEEDKMQMIKTLLILRKEQKYAEARDFYMRHGGEDYFEKPYKDLRHWRYRVKKIDNDYVMCNQSETLRWIMNTEELIQCVDDALESLKQRCKTKSRFSVWDIKQEMTQKGWIYHPKSVDCAFVAKEHH